jgi:hypothetical protein
VGIQLSRDIFLDIFICFASCAYTLFVLHTYPGHIFCAIRPHRLHSEPHTVVHDVHELQLRPDVTPLRTLRMWLLFCSAQPDMASFTAFTADADPGG